MNIPVKNCSSCMACANICARNAIEIVQDVEGFYRPQIDEELCVKCGACERVCPWNHLITNPNSSSERPQTFAAYSNDDNIRLNSSSGGIFSVLAKTVLREGGVVVGVGYKDPTHLEFKIVETEAEMKDLRLSKYFQANVGLIYKTVKKLLQEGRKVLVSGTSCQVAALYAVLGKRLFENLTTIDIVCHGVPSQKVFEKYIQELESRKGKVVNTNFRDKVSGWKRFSLTNIFESEYVGICKESKILREDTFMQAFLDNLCLNKSCMNCNYGKLPRIADITLGDYWNIAKHHPEMDDDKGTSVVLLNTDHGKDLFHTAQNAEANALTMTVCVSQLEYAIDGNPCIVRSSHAHKNRDTFMAMLNSATLPELLKKFNHPQNKTIARIRKFLKFIKNTLEDPYAK